jgi:hypothetical protein
VGRVSQGEGYPEQACNKADPTYGVLGTLRRYQGSDDREDEERHVCQQLADGFGGRVAGGLRNPGEDVQDDTPDEHGRGEASQRPRQPGSDPAAHFGGSLLKGFSSLSRTRIIPDASLREDRLPSVTKSATKPSGKGIPFATSQATLCIRGHRYNH